MASISLPSKYYLTGGYLRDIFTSALWKLLLMTPNAVFGLLLTALAPPALVFIGQPVRYLVVSTLVLSVFFKTIVVVAIPNACTITD